MLVFPFDVIPEGSEIAIYGAGANARIYLKQIAISHWCKVIMVVDSNYHLIQNFSQVVYAPDALKNCTFDYVVLSMSDNEARKQAKERLLKIGIKDEKIISESNAVIYRDEYENIQVLPDDGGIKIQVGFCVGEPIGDQIIFAKFFQVLMEQMEKGEADIFCKNREVTEALFYGQPNLRNVIPYHPSCMDMQKYDIFFFSSFLPRLKIYRPEKIKRLSPRFFPQMEKIFFYQMNCSPGSNIPVFVSKVMMDRAMFNGKDRYTLQDCDGALPITDKKVRIVCNPAYKTSYSAMGLTKPFMTFNYGASDVMHDGRMQTKIWPFEYYKTLIGIIKKNFPKLKIVQIGGKDTKKIDGADSCLMGLPLEIIKYVLKDSIIHIDCESGLPHLATQLGTKCTVMFGPTPIWFFGYEENINIAPKICGGCKGLVKDWYVRCIKYEKPECMYSITPETVFSHMEEYLRANLC